MILQVEKKPSKLCDLRVFGVIIIRSVYGKNPILRVVKKRILENHTPEKTGIACGVMVIGF
jgi:hypothetical protein